MEPDLQQRFLTNIEKHKLLAEGDKVLVAVSGGVDSMVLLDLFRGSGYSYSVAHCNFQLRGQESDEDERMVRNECKSAGILCFVRRFDTEREMELTGESVQIAARRLRYDWFRELCEEHGYCKVAIAHHADDSIETFFINLVRGTGLKGLTGISVNNGRIIRPLMFATRKEIIDHAQAGKIMYREDSSNLSTKYLRNKIRLGLIPRFKEISPSFTGTMTRNVERLTETNNFVMAAMGKIRCRVEKHRDGMVIIDPAGIDPVYPLNFVLFQLMDMYGFKGETVDALISSLESGSSGKTFYSGSYAAYTDRGSIIISAIAQDDLCELTVDAADDRFHCGNTTVRMEVMDIDRAGALIQPEDIALVDADKLKFPLVVRKWKEGDWFYPFGMNEKKKLSDFLIDSKVSMPEKNRQFVVVSGEDIVWVVGRRIDNRFRVTGSTENVLRMARDSV